MDNKNTGGPAFPTGSQPEPNLYSAPGMTLRDYFAATALPSVLDAAETTGDSTAASIPSTAAAVAYAIADAMLLERAKAAAPEQPASALLQTLSALDRWMREAGYAENHPWRASIFAAIAKATGAAA